MKVINNRIKTNITDVIFMLLIAILLVFLLFF